MYQQSLPTQCGQLVISATDFGIHSVQFDECVVTEHKNSHTEAAYHQLSEYFTGQRHEFDLELDTKGTPFQQQVWRALTNIDYGTTASYADIASAIGKPKAVRAVGAANGRNPIAIIVPCHRIIGKNGTLTGYAGGLARKAYLLELEQGANECNPRT